MQEVHSGYKQSLDASSKQRVRQVCSLEPEQLGTWLTRPPGIECWGTGFTRLAMILLILLQSRFFCGLG